MSNTRVDQLKESYLLASITRLEQEMREKKVARQYISGASIVWFTLQTGDTYDWSGTIPDTGGTGFGGKMFLITATAQTMDAFYGNVFANIYADAGHTLYTPAAALADLAAGNDHFLTSFTDVPNNTANPKAKQWYCDLQGNTSRQVAIKFWVEALDQATITVTALT